MLTAKEILGEDIWKFNLENYEQLKKEIENGSVTWVLGAGISVPAGLPNWEKLLAKMWARLSLFEKHNKSSNQNSGDKAFEEAKKKKRACHPNYPIYRKKMDIAFQGEYKEIFEGENMLATAEYMWAYIDLLLLGNEAEKGRGILKMRILKALLQDALYVSFQEDELKNILSKQAVGNLAVLLKKQGAGTVITYNYDDLLEFCLDKIAGASAEEVKVICNYDDEKAGERGKINIHHLHGALRLTKNKFSHESEKIILTEYSYYELEQKAYIWENSVQAKGLTDAKCVFMGFSGDDDHFRRIIKNMEENRSCRHYIFLCLNDLFDKVYKKEVDMRYQEYRDSLGNPAWTHEEIEEETDRIRSEVLASDEFVYEWLQLINKIYAQYHYWRKHGIIPIWTTFAELPEMIREFC